MKERSEKVEETPVSNEACRGGMDLMSTIYMPSSGATAK